MMIIGLDFDNTIVCYDRLFHRLALERGLVPCELPATKRGIRAHLRSSGLEDEWTMIQGIAYGPRIADAEPFPGVKEFLSQCHSRGITVAIVSHKTQYPYRGEKYDLHTAAHTFLNRHGFYESKKTGLSSAQVYFEHSLRQKLERIGLLGCAAFVDDLPEVLTEPAFPRDTHKVLFDPGGIDDCDRDYARVTSWESCADHLLARVRVLA
jgi:hypothetical protein